MQLEDFAAPHFNAKEWINRHIATNSNYAATTTTNSNNSGPGVVGTNAAGGETTTSPTFSSSSLAKDQRGATGSGSSSTSSTAGAEPLEAQLKTVGQTFTQLQVHSQETATALEEMITQSLTRLPRAALEVQRMGQETDGLLQQLSSTTSVVKKQAIGPEPRKRMAELHQARTKLIRCQSVLKEAKSLAHRVTEVEQKIDSFAVVSKNSKDGEGEEVKELEHQAAEIASLQASLTELRNIEPSFGAHLQSKVSSFETRLQESLERQCLESLRSRDRVRAPKLLLALRKIDRDGEVIDSFVQHLTQKRKDHFLHEAKNASAPSSITLCVTNFYKSLGRMVTSDAEYISLLFNGDEKSVLNFQMKMLQGVFHSTSQEISEKLQSLDNTNLVKCFSSLSDLGSSLLKNYPETLFDLASSPYQGMMETFIRNETGKLNHLVETSSNVASVFDAIEDSFKRCSLFFPGKSIPVCTKSWDDALYAFAENTEKKAQGVSSSFTQTPSPRQGGSESLASTISKGPSPTGSTTTSSSSTHYQNVDLREILSIYKSTVKMLPAVKAFDAQLLSKVQGIIATTTTTTTTTTRTSASAGDGEKKESNAAVSELLLPRSVTKFANVVKKCEKIVSDVLLSPIRSKLAVYETLPAWREPSSSTAGSSGHPKSFSASYSSGHATPSEAIRFVGEVMMELPMVLESHNVDPPDVQVWMVCVREGLVVDLIAVLRKLTLRHRGAVEQLQADLEYVQNVMSAVSDEPSAEIQEIMEKTAFNEGKGEPSSDSPVALSSIL